MPQNAINTDDAIGIISGTGPAGRGLAARLATAGTTTVIGSREASKATDTVAGLVERWGADRMAPLSAGDNGAAAACDFVVIATDAGHALAVAEAHREDLASKVVVTMAAKLARTDRGMTGAFPPEGSIANALQRILPESQVVAALHHVPAAILGDLDAELDADVLTCCDTAEGIDAVRAHLAPATSGRFLDAGPLDNAHALEALTAVIITVNRTTGTEHSLRLVDTHRA